MIPDTITIRIPDMKNREDGDRIRRAIESLPGIFSVETSVDDADVQVMYDTSVLPEHAIHGTIESAGYTTSRESN